MRTKHLRALCGDNTKYSGYTYPDNFFAHDDHFTMHIPFFEMLFQKINFINKENLNFLEIGTAHGRSAIWMLENVLINSSCKLTCVDLNHEMYLDKFKNKNGEIIFDLKWSSLENLKPYIDSKKCDFYKSTSNDFFEHLRQKSNVKINKKYEVEFHEIENVKTIEIFDFVYIDGNHDPEQVLKDSINAFEFLKPNGYILFDDYPWKNPKTNLICGFGIESFLHTFNHKIKILHKDYQVLIQKI